MELPKVLNEYGVLDEYILYVDTDIMFLGSIDLDCIKPSYFSSSSDWDNNDWSRFSTGVMVMNIHNLFEKYPSFLAHLKSHRFNFPNTDMGPCDQGAWNTFYINNEHEKLDPLYDWKPWWGHYFNTCFFEELSTGKYKFCFQQSNFMYAYTKKRN